MRDPNVYRFENALRNLLVLAGAGVVLLIPLVVVVWLAGPYVLPWLEPVLASGLWFPLIVMAVLVGTIMSLTAVCILAERKIAAFTQDRRGPNRVGFWGLLQPMADGLKFFLKEDITPTRVDKPLFLLAPGLALAVSLLGIAIIPWAGYVHWPWMADGAVVSTQVASIDIGFLYLVAVGSLSVYGIVIGGYASNNKYSFMGGMRATAQMISYELPLGLALLCLLLLTGTLRPELIVEQQATTGVWNVCLQPLAFVLLLIASFAEGNRAPFDLAEAEQELVGGFHTEYSSMKFASFFLAEYAHMIIGSALLATLFLGGWHFWGIPGTQPEDVAWWALLVKFAVLFAKIGLLVFLFMLVRWTLPRFRFDQLMRVAWLGLVPAGIGLLVLTSVLTAYNLQRTFWMPLANLALLVGIIVWSARQTHPVTGRQGYMPQVEVRPR